MEKVVQGRSTDSAEIEAARERLAGVARETPLVLLGDVLAACGPQGARSRRRTCSARARSRSAAPTTRSRRSPRTSARQASSPRARETTARRSRGRRARSAFPATIFMPEEASDGEGRGDDGRTAAPSSSSARASRRAVAAAQDHVERTGARLVHAFEDPRVVAGQGTIGLELAEQAAEAETVLIPVGGGRPRGRHLARLARPRAWTARSSASPAGRASRSRTASR